MSSSATGARSQNSFHHFFNANMLSGVLTSNINKAASAPLKKAVERLENLSWPAVSYNGRSLAFILLSNDFITDDIDPDLQYD